MTERITEPELARDLHAVLEKVRQGSEVIVEREDHKPVAIISSPLPKARKLSESIALAEARGASAVAGESFMKDEGFMKDVMEGIAQRSKPWTPASWE